MKKMEETFLHNQDDEAPVKVQTHDDEDGKRYFILRELDVDGTTSAGMALSEENVIHLYRILGSLLAQ